MKWTYPLNVIQLLNQVTYIIMCMYVYCYLENQFMFFKQQPVVAYILTSVLSTLQHRCHWLSRCWCKHFIIWRMTQNLIKNIISIVASSYQVNLAIEIPNITENYINSHVFTCRHWLSAMLIQIYITLLGSFFDWPDIFLFRRAGS